MSPQIISSAIFLVALLLIFTEKVHRTIIALVAALLMIVVGTYAGFYSQEQALEVIDFNTLGLLMGMMLLVALLEPTGFFQYLAIWGGKLSRGQPVRLLIMLGAVTSIVSMFLDNVTTIVLIAPVTILICEILGYNTQPFLISEAILSNTGGVATLVGDPPNILIASAAGFSFNDFLVHSLPIVIVTWFVALAVLNLLFRKEFQSLKNKTNHEALMQLEPKSVLKDLKTTRKVLVVIILAFFGFLLESVIHLEPSTIAFTSAAIALLWVRPPDLKHTLNLIEWDILIFFGALFVMVGGLEKAGVLHIFTQALTEFAHLHPLVLGVGLIWIVAIISSFVDNIPITIALIPVLQELGTLGFDITPLWWALVFGAGLGGNGTIIGSTANVIVTSLSEKTRNPITPALWNKKGLPVMLATCFTASLLYIAFYYWIGF